MSQAFHVLTTTNTVYDDVARHNDNYAALKSSFSGTSFPASPMVGQECWRTDRGTTTANGTTGKKYTYTGDTSLGDGGWVDSEATGFVQDEVVRARGTKLTLDERLDVSLNEDGTLRPLANMGSEWVLPDVTFTKVTSTSFTTSGNTSDIYLAERRVKVNSDSVGFTEVVSSSYDGATTTVVLKDAIIGNSLVSVEHSIISPFKDSSGGALSYYSQDYINSSFQSKNSSGDIIVARHAYVDGNVRTDQITNRTGTQLVLNAGESQGKVAGQTYEKVYLNAEGGLEVSNPDSAHGNWNSGYTVERATLKGRSLDFNGEARIDVESINKGLLYKGDIPDAIDLNVYVAPGIYHQNSSAQASNGTNYPENLAGMLQVTGDGSMVYQVYTVYGTYRRVYHRTYYNGTWYGWKLLMNYGDTAYNSDRLGSVGASNFARSDIDDTLTGSYLWSAGAYHGLYWGEIHKDADAHSGGWSYIRSGAAGVGSLEIGSDDKLQIYETDGHVLAIDISTNNKTLDAKGGLLEAGVKLADKYLGIADKASDSDKLDGYNSSQASTANTVAVRNASGDINARLFRSEYDNTNSTIGFIMTQVNTDSDNYIRPSTPSQLVAGLPAADLLGKIKLIDGHGSGLDSDTVDGLHGADIAKTTQTSSTDTIYTDATTGVNYKLYIDNGALVLEEL